MAQIFHRSFNTISRASIVVVLLAVAALTTAAALAYRSGWYTRQRCAIAQPVPFSHEHHVSGLGLDCRFCHTGVENSSFAGIPPTETCMICHSQIWTNAPMLAPVRQSLADDTSLTWHRVARLPDYVYFRHDIHIAKGVGCVTCHGRVDQMALTFQAKPLTMEFCLDCHRDPAPHLRPHDRITDMDWQPEDARMLGETLVKQNGIRLGEITYCYVCHR
jgi:hypothetical protein